MGVTWLLYESDIPFQVCWKQSDYTEINWTKLEYIGVVRVQTHKSFI